IRQAFRSGTRVVRAGVACRARPGADGRHCIAPRAQRALELSDPEWAAAAHALWHELGRSALEHDRSRGAIRAVAVAVTPEGQPKGQPYGLPLCSADAA